MSRRDLWLGLGLALVTGLGLRLWATGHETTARPEDAAYYVGVAENLVRGRGLVIDAIWTYATPPLVLPKPAFEIWLPLPTFLAAVPMLLAGATFAAAQWAAILVGLGVVALAVRLGADAADELDLPRARAITVTWGTGLAAAAVLPLVLHSVQPDSTMPFALLALAASMVMARILARSRVGTGVEAQRVGAGPLIALGVLLGLAALARNEAAWVALTWAVFAWRLPLARLDRLRLVAVPAVAAIAVYAPWAVREWLVFGTPLPGQALLNALSVKGTDIFAWRDPPTLARYLAQGPEAILGARWTALEHDLVVDLLLLGMPVSALGLLGLPTAWRLRALRPLIVSSVLIFLVTTFVFPIATTWGTFLHAAGAIHVLLAVSAALLVDRVAAAASARFGWTRPISWTGATLVTLGAMAFTLAILPGSTPGAVVVARFGALPAALEAAIPGASAAPVITDTPIFLATKTDLEGLALPDEPPADVLALARAYGARSLVLDIENVGRWPEILTAAGAGPAAACFVPVDLAAAAAAAGQDPAALDGILAYRIEESCP